MIPRADAKTLVLTHLLAQIDQPAVREQIVHEIRQTFDGKVPYFAALPALS
jgi:ribonuclease BN (tRNA processing enzyme)